MASAEDVEPIREPQKVEALSQYMEAAQAFDHGELERAAAALEKAYVISPGDPQVKALMGKIEAARRAREQAIGQAVQAARQAQVSEAGVPIVDVAGAPAAGAAEPLKERMKLPGVPALGLERLFTPPEEGRPEILEAGKRAGYQRLYKEGIGLQPVPGLGFSSRFELFEEPNPVEDFVLEADIEKFDSLAEFRRSVLPLFTRSWAARVVADYEPWPRFQYEFDDREILHELETRFAVKDRHLETHSFSALYSFPRLPGLGVLTVNPFYKRVFQTAKNDNGSFENKDEVELLVSLRSSDNLEYFFKYQGAENAKNKTVGGSKDQIFQGQLRLRFPGWKLFAIPSYQHSRTTYDPSDDELVKEELFVDWGFDLTPRLRASSKEELVFLELTQAGKSPSNPEAQVYNIENTLSYELFRDFDVSVGFDHSAAFGLNAYDNYSIRTEMELFKPGLIRARVGYQWVSYYHISDDLSLVYFRVFLFQ